MVRGGPELRLREIFFAPAQAPGFKKFLLSLLLRKKNLYSGSEGLAPEIPELIKNFTLIFLYFMLKN